MLYLFVEERNARCSN